MKETKVRIQKIEKVREETDDTRTLYFQDSRCTHASPGQFIMVWIPNVDEIPLSLSKIGNVSAVTVKKVGDATRSLCTKSKGDKIGIRGPYGNGFNLVEEKVAVIAGGTGVCAIRPLVHQLREVAASIQYFIGAKTKQEILFLEEIRNLLSRQEKFTVATEDGSMGLTGMITEVFEKTLEKTHFNMVYTCGPELMMHKIFELAKKQGIKIQASLERIIRCGVGLCGSCSFGPYRVCNDGPVFTSSQLEKVDEFGRVKRDFSGRPIQI